MNTDEHMILAKLQFVSFYAQLHFTKWAIVPTYYNLLRPWDLELGYVLCCHNIVYQFYDIVTLISAIQTELLPIFNSVGSSTKFQKFQPGNYQKSHAEYNFVRNFIIRHATACVGLLLAWVYNYE